MNADFPARVFRDPHVQGFVLMSSVEAVLSTGPVLAVLFARHSLTVQQRRRIPQRNDEQSRPIRFIHARSSAEFLYVHSELILLRPTGSG